MTEEQIKRKFPAGFREDLLPAGAKEQSITVYRVCPTGAVEAASFLPTYLDKELTSIKEYDPDDPGTYSLSTFENLNHAQKLLKCSMKYHPAPIIACGITEPAFGPSQRTKDRIENRVQRARVRSHVDWWLYDGAQPEKSFVQEEGGNQA